MEVQPAADVLQEFLSECETKLMQFAPQNISNMLWACATLGVSPGRSLASISKMLTSASLLTAVFQRHLQHRHSLHMTMCCCVPFFAGHLDFHQSQMCSGMNCRKEVSGSSDGDFATTAL